MPKRYLSYILFSIIISIFIFNYLKFAAHDTRGYLDIHEVGYFNKINHIDAKISLDNLNITKFIFTNALKIFPQNYMFFRLINLLLFLLFIYIYYSYVYKHSKSFFAAQAGIYFLLSMPGIVAYSRIIWPQIYSASFLFLIIMHIHKLKTFKPKNFIVFIYLILACGFHYSGFAYALLIALFYRLFLTQKAYKYISIFSIIIIITSFLFSLKTPYTNLNQIIFKQFFDNFFSSKMFNLTQIHDFFFMFFISKYIFFLYLFAFFIICIYYIPKIHTNTLFLLIFILGSAFIIPRALDASIFYFLFFLNLIIIRILSFNFKYINSTIYIVFACLAILLNTNYAFVGISDEVNNNKSKLSALKIDTTNNSNLSALKNFLLTFDEKNISIGVLNLDYFIPNNQIITPLDIYLLQNKKQQISAQSFTFHNTEFTHKNYPVTVTTDFKSFADLDYFILDKFNEDKNQVKEHKDVLNIITQSNKMVLIEEIKSEIKTTYVFKNKKNI